MRLLRAQRLSASEIQHPFLGFTDNDAKVLCSTPFGIRDSTLNPKPDISPVLEGCSTPFGIRDSTPSSSYSLAILALCAQRLSASEIQHRRKPKRVFYLLGAQRLSASEIQHKVGEKVLQWEVSAQRLSASEIQHA